MIYEHALKGQTMIALGKTQGKKIIANNKKP